MFLFRFLNRNYPISHSNGHQKISPSMVAFCSSFFSSLLTPLLCVAFGALPFVTGHPAHAQTFIVTPNSLTTTDGNSASPTLDTSLARTYQTQIAASQLTNFATGTVIRGLSYRLDSTNGTVPSSDLTFTNYQITFSQAANSLTNFSTTFADNIKTGTGVTVYNRALTLPASIYSSSSSGSTAEAFGPTINFTSGYTYTGGDLVITIRHTGNQQGLTPVLDAINATSSDFGTTIKGQYNNNASDPYTATTANVTNSATVLRLNTTVTPEPGTLSLLGMGLVTGGGVVGMVKRRKAKTAARRARWSRGNLRIGSVCQLQRYAHWLSPM